MQEMTENQVEEIKVAVFKIILVGDVNVGKTNIINRYINNDFLDNSQSTVGVDLKTKYYYLDNIKVKEQIWDTAGSEKYQSISGVYYKGADGVLLVYDMTNYQTLENLRNWLSLVRSYISEDAEIFLIGNKSDLEHKKKVTNEDIQEFLDREGKYS